MPLEDVFVDWPFQGIPLFIFKDTNHTTTIYYKQSLSVYQKGKNKILLSIISVKKEIAYKCIRRNDEI